jgi:hypothetical protein
MGKGKENRKAKKTPKVENKEIAKAKPKEQVKSCH